MLISNISRQCVLKMKDYSKKKNNSSRRNRNQSSNDSKINHTDDNLNISSNAITPLVAGSNQTDRRTSNNQLNDRSQDIVDDKSCLGRLLNCKPCRQVTENQKEKIVGSANNGQKRRSDLFRKQTNGIGRTVRQISTGITKRKNSTRKLKKQTKYKKNWTIFPTGKIKDTDRSVLENQCSHLRRDCLSE